MNVTSHRVAALLGIACAPWLIQCGSSSADAGPQFAYPDVASYCHARAAAECSSKLVEVCATSLTTCITKRQALCPQAGKYRPSAAEACVAAVADMYQDAQITGAEQARVNQACAPVFGGTVGPGASCAVNSDCDLDQDLQCVRLKCEKPAEVSVGSSCKADDAVCEKGNYCDLQIQKCVNDQTAGDDCSEATPCAADLRCVPTAAGAATGTCQQKVQDGGACSTDEDCAGGLCIQAPGGDAGATTQRCASVRVLSPYDPFCEQSAP